MKMTIKTAAVSRIIKGKVFCLNLSAFDNRGRRFARAEAERELEAMGASSQTTSSLGEASIGMSKLRSSIIDYNLSADLLHYTPKI